MMMNGLLFFLYKAKQQKVKLFINNGEIHRSQLHAKYIVKLKRVICGIKLFVLRMNMQNREYYLAIRLIAKITYGIANALMQPILVAKFHYLPMVRVI